MILLREDNFLQRNDSKDNDCKSIFVGISKGCNHEKDLSNLAIYQCCYEICCEKCLKSSQYKESHNCALIKDNNVKDTLVPVKLSTIFPIMLQKQDQAINNVIGRNLNVISCPVCQKSSISNKKLKFYDCLNCNGQYCEKCQLIVHGKGKFMFHQVKQVERMRQKANKSGMLSCEIHNKTRRCLLKDEIVCESCFKETTGRVSTVNQCADLSITSQNVRFSTQHYSEVYHNEGNRISQAKQNLTKIYQQMIERIEERYHWNMSQLEKTQSNLKKVFTKNLNEIEKIDQELQLITLNQQKLVDLINKDIINIRTQLINEKLFQVQSKCEDFIGEINFQYKVGDKEKYEHLIEQFLKCLNVTKFKRVEEESIYTNRSLMRNQLKSSRATSRPSSNRLTNSKENRCNSSFKKNDFSSNKQNSSFKDKNVSKNDSNKKFQDTNSSLKKNINRSVSVRIPAKDNSQGVKNNLNFLKDKELNLKDVKDLEKAEYQDLNLNLKKIIASRKPTEIVNSTSYIEKVSERPSENTSLQKINLQVQNINKKPLLTKQNQKCQFTSGSFLKLLQTSKSKVSSRKNYLLSSAQELSENESIGKQYKSRIQIITSNMKIISPQKSSQLKRRNIKQELFGSNQYSNQNKSDLKFGESSSPVQKPSKTKKEPLFGQSQQSHQNPSLIFDKLIAVSNEKSSPQPTSQFNHKCPEETLIQAKNPKVLSTSEISQFSTVLTHESELKNTSQSIKNVAMISSVQICEFNAKQSSQVKKGKTKVPSTSKVLQNKQNNQNKHFSPNMLIDDGKSIPNCSQNINTSNIMKGSQKLIQEKAPANAQNEKAKKKPDFMDMRQRMRKPNYLSTRFGSNISQAAYNIKGLEIKK